MSNHPIPPAGSDRRHELKTDPAVFEAVVRGDKTHEIRLNDRGFAVGDTLLLRETKDTGWEMATCGVPLVYTGRTATRTVSHIQTGYGLADGWCILSFRAAGAPAETAKAVQRYDLVEKQHGRGHMVYFEKEMEADPEGGWVKFADLAAPQIDATTARAEVSSITPGQGKVELLLDGDVHDWLDPGCIVYVSTAPATAPDVAKDAARLDWLDQQGCSFGFEDMHEGNEWKIGGPYATIRKAIDAQRAAMGALPPTGSEKA